MCLKMNIYIKKILIIVFNKFENWKLNIFFIYQELIINTPTISVSKVVLSAAIPENLRVSLPNSYLSLVIGLEDGC